MSGTWPLPRELVLPLQQRDRQWVPCVDVGADVEAGEPIADAFGVGTPLCAPASARVQAIEHRPASADGATAACIVLAPHMNAHIAATATIAVMQAGDLRNMRVAVGTPLAALLDAAALHADIVLLGDAIRGVTAVDRRLPLLIDTSLQLLDADAFAALPAWLVCDDCNAASPWSDGPLPPACAECGADAVRPGPSPALDGLRRERRERDAERLRLARADAARLRHRRRNARLAAAAAARAERIVTRTGGSDAVQAALARARAKRDGTPR